MYEKPRVNVNVEPRSTFTFTSDLAYVVSNLFTHVKPVNVYVRTQVKITRQWKSTFTQVIIEIPKQRNVTIYHNLPLLIRVHTTLLASMCHAMPF